jgi:hypothetical protein
MSVMREWKEEMENRRGVGFGFIKVIRGLFQRLKRTKTNVATDHHFLKRQPLSPDRIKAIRRVATRVV